MPPLSTLLPTTGKFHQLYSRTAPRLHQSHTPSLGDCRASPWPPFCTQSRPHRVSACLYISNMVHHTPNEQGRGEWVLPATPDPRLPGHFVQTHQQCAFSQTWNPGYHPRSWHQLIPTQTALAQTLQSRGSALRPQCTWSPSPKPHPWRTLLPGLHSTHHHSESPFFGYLSKPPRINVQQEQPPDSWLYPWGLAPSRPWEAG